MLESFLCGRWVRGEGVGTPIHDALDGSVVSSASTAGLDLIGALDHARSVGGPTLRAQTFAQRGAWLEALAKSIFAGRDALVDASRHGGTTRGDAKFDIDGAAGTLAWYGALGRSLGDRTVLLDGPPEPVLRSARFAGQHIFTPRLGAAVHINAFNFPAWGLCEKAAVAWLAGVPVVAKPATATAPLAVALVRRWLDEGLLPEGVLQLVVGNVGDLLDGVGAQDSVAFTGSAATAEKLRAHAAVVVRGARLNVEADSLNVAILGPDADEDTTRMFALDCVRDMTQKAGQKCTAIRRILVPQDRMDDVVEALVERLAAAAVGDPADKGTTTGPVASPAQREAVVSGTARLVAAGRVVWRGEAPEGGCFVAPTLLAIDGGVGAPVVHDEEVFGPVASLLPYDGSAKEAVAIAARGGGGLVASLYSDELAWAREVILGLAPWHGRIHWGSRKVADQSPGPGTVLPTLCPGGAGRAGGGEELGGERGLRFYLQRTAVMGDRAMMERMFAS